MTAEALRQALAAGRDVPKRWLRQVSGPVRAAAGCPHTRTPVVILDGDTPPRVLGEEARVTNGYGETVYRPDAYRRAGGKLVYRASTLRVEVGAGWLIQNGLV